MKSNKAHQITLQFASKWERDQFELYYRSSGTTSFSSWLMSNNKKGRTVIEKRLKHWPNFNECIVK